MRAIPTRSLIRFLAATLLLGLSAWQARAATIGFAAASYSARPGDTLELVVQLSEPVANGLEGYALKLDFPAGVLSVSAIEIVPALDFDVFEAGAIRDAGAGFASIAGFSQFGQPAYTGTSFVTFRLSVRADAPAGSYSLDLGPLLADAVNFVDGLGTPLDGQLVFGSASLEILPAWPPENISDLRIDLVQGQAQISFTGTPGRPYKVLASSSLQEGSWLSLGIVTAPENGRVELVDPLPGPPANRFYRLSAP